MQAPDEVALGNAVKSILSSIKGGLQNPENILAQVRAKLAEQRKFNNDLKRAIDASGWPTNRAHQGLVEKLVAQKCNKKPDYFSAKQEQQKKDKALKDLADAQAAEQERKAHEKLRVTVEQQSPARPW